MFKNVLWSRLRAKKIHLEEILLGDDCAENKMEKFEGTFCVALSEASPVPRDLVFDSFAKYLVLQIVKTLSGAIRIAKQ